MDDVRFTNLADVNCWMVYLMPFNNDEKEDYDLVNEFQNKCIEKKIFGMGWSSNCFKSGTEITLNYKEKYIDDYNSKNEYDVSRKAVDAFWEIKEGDFVITRLKNVHYFVGKVKAKKADFLSKDDKSENISGRLSWCANVDKWVEYQSETKIPSEIVGRFSQKLHSTVKRINSYRIKMLVIAMYEKDNEKKEYNIPKVHINKSNFVRCLTYKELEDLVAIYIAKEHKDYYFLPSSCKVSQQKYEFMFVKKESKPITCQVKNQSEIVIDHYLNEDAYEKVYLFSGLWSDEKVDELNREYKRDNIFIISQNKLYNILKEDRIISNPFYDYDTNEIDIRGLERINEFKRAERRLSKSCYKIENDYVYFANKGLYYSMEFNSLILEYHFKNDKETVEKAIKCLKGIVS